jgi:pyruvate/2-oxoglutarate dehydrogenase complex dihydrolipoamide dehydrogenase (E3) component
MVRVGEYLRSAIWQVCKVTTREALQQKGMDIRVGAVSFVGPHTVTVGDRRISANEVIIATGAIPVASGLSNGPLSTYRTISENDHLPASMVVIGVGPAILGWHSRKSSTSDWCGGEDLNPYALRR